MYSASVVERSTQAYFLQCQEIRLDPSMWPFVLVLFLSILQLEQSKSEKTVKLKETLLGYNSPTSLVPCKYFRILLAAL